MIDTDKYEELLENGMQHRDLWELASELLAEVKRLNAKLFEAELWVNNDSYTFENDMKELNDYAEAIE